MTAAERAALDRVIAAIRSNWIIAIPLSAKWPTWEADAHAIADAGLTAKQAREVVDNLDTPEKRETAKQYIGRLSAPADAETLLEWLVRDCKRALSTSGDVVVNTGGGVVNTATPHKGAVLYLPANCGWFNGGEDLGAVIAWLAQYRGRVGLGFEATGSTGNMGVRTVDWRVAYADHCKRLAILARQCAAAGVPVKIDAINSNDFGKGWSSGWKDTTGNRDAVLSIMRGLATDLLAVRDWCIVQPVSEDDASMPADFRAAAMGVWVKAGWPRNRLCMDGGIAETHTGELKPLNPPALAATDNGPAIEKHFGKGVWTAHTPNVERCAAYARHYLTRGVHASLYHRADRLHLLEHRAAYDQIIARAVGQDAPPVTPGSSPGSHGAARLLSFEPDGGTKRKPYVKFQLSGVDGWANDKSGTNAWIVVKDVKVEHIRAGYKRQHLGNAYGKDEHAVAIKHGETVPVYFVRNDGKERTNSINFVWPWESTQ